jgi:hypothetical protein
MQRAWKKGVKNPNSIHHKPVSEFPAEKKRETQPISHPNQLLPLNSFERQCYSLNLQSDHRKHNNITLESFLSLPPNTSQERFQTRSNKGEGRKEGRRDNNGTPYIPWRRKEKTLDVPFSLQLQQLQRRHDKKNRWWII